MDMPEPPLPQKIDLKGGIKIANSIDHSFTESPSNHHFASTEKQDFQVKKEILSIEDDQQV
jgi:hypothetical protein